MAKIKTRRTTTVRIAMGFSQEELETLLKEALARRLPTQHPGGERSFAFCWDISQDFLRELQVTVETTTEDLVETAAHRELELLSTADA